MKFLLLFLFAFQIFGIEISVSDNVKEVLKSNFIIGSDIAFRKNDRKTSFYLAAQSNIPEQIIVCLDVKKEQGTISRFVTLKGLELQSHVDKISLLPDDKAWGFDVKELILYKINLKSGEIYSKLVLKEQMKGVKIFDLAGDSNLLNFLINDSGLRLIRFNLINNKIEKIDLSVENYEQASLSSIGFNSYMIYAARAETNQIFSLDSNNLKLIDSWKGKGLNSVTLLDDGKTIAYLENNKLTYRLLPEALIVWTAREWILVVILSIITVLGFVLLFKVITK